MSITNDMTAPTNFITQYFDVKHRYWQCPYTMDLVYDEDVSKAFVYDKEIHAGFDQNNNNTITLYYTKIGTAKVRMRITTESPNTTAPFNKYYSTYSQPFYLSAVCHEEKDSGRCDPKTKYGFYYGVLKCPETLIDDVSDCFDPVSNRTVCPPYYVIKNNVNLNRFQVDIDGKKPSLVIKECKWGWQEFKLKSVISVDTNLTMLSPENRGFFNASVLDCG